MYNKCFILCFLSGQNPLETAVLSCGTINGGYGARYLLLLLLLFVLFSV